MDWIKLIIERSRLSGILRVDELAQEFNYHISSVRYELHRQEERGLVEHFGKKIFINLVTPNFSGRELINMLRPEAYLSLDSVLRDSGVSTQSPTVLTCVTPGPSAEFHAKSVSIRFRRLSRKLFWGFKERHTRYGKYNVADPEKALLDWIYWRHQMGGTVHADELDLQRLDRGKLLEYAEDFPLPVKQQILEAVANFDIVQPGA